MAARAGRGVNEIVWGRCLGLGSMIVVLALAGCHTGSLGANPSQEPSVTSPSPAAPTTELTIVVDLGTGGPKDTWRLTCNPVGGNHPDPVGACQALEVNGAAALPPVPKDRACTMIYGGPEQATVTGTWNGEKVNATFSRTNGCEMNRWAQMVPLLPEPTT